MTGPPSPPSTSNPLVSVIIPAFNRADYLPRATESVLRQTFRDFELIIVDDGSTDGTREYLLSVEDPRFRHFFQPNRGVSSARNLGIKNAAGTYMAFLDSDDEWEPSKLERQIEALEENPGYLAVHSNEIWIRKGKRVNQKNKHRKYGGWIFDYCLPLCVISPSSILLHRRILEQTGVFKESFPVCEDYELWLRMASRYPVLFLDEELLRKYGGHPDQLSRKYWGMDRFRVKALAEIISGGGLTPWQKLRASQELSGKCLILEKGFRKRGKREEARDYQKMAREYGARPTMEN